MVNNVVTLLFVGDKRLKNTFCWKSLYALLLISVAVIFMVCNPLFMPPTSNPMAY